MKKLLNLFFNKLYSYFYRDLSKLIKSSTKQSNFEQAHIQLMIDRYLRENLYEHPKYQDSKKLNKYECKVYSQNGEDGIIEEIFNRIGITNKYFVEFGVGNGLENNTVYLLIKGWKGYWIEGSPNFCKRIEKDFHDHIQQQQLQLKQAFITAENIENLFAEAKVPQELDLLSIDIDGNDYWVWKAIDNYRPRVVIVEYNALYPPNTNWIMKYNPNHSWKYDSYFGASLSSLENLATLKGYKLVACCFSGINAFFVREDLVGDHFLSPYTSENHYEYYKPFLRYNTKGHPSAFGLFENI